MRKTMKRKKEYWIMFIALLALCYLFPYTGDDWAWGSQIGIDRLNIWFDNYSGRYFGNLIVLALTRSRLLRTVIMAVCLSGIVILINKLTGEHKIGFYVIAMALLFLPVSVLRQSIVWTAGFSNYTTSIFLTLIYVYYVRNIYEDVQPRYSKLAIIPLVVLGGLNTLIVEHLTIYNVVLSIYVIIFSICKFKKVYIQHLAYLLGSIIGTIYMFSNSVYRSVAEGSDGYRAIGSEKGIVSKAVDSYLDVIMKEGILNNVMINVLLFIVCLIVWKEIKDMISSKAYIAGKLSMVTICSYTIISILNGIGNTNQTELLEYIEGAATILYALAVIIFYIIQPVDLNRKIKILFIVGSIVCIMGPLLVVSPIGSRCFFATYVMFIYLIMETYNLLSEAIRKKIEELTQYSKVVTIISFFYIFYIYGTIFVCDKNRVDKAIADANSGKETIEVEDLPYSLYLWCSVPETGSVWEERFKLFYGIDSKITIKNIRNYN